MAKKCARCGKEIDCKHDVSCFCVPFAMSDAMRAYLKEHYNDCLCQECLSAVKAKFANTLILDFGGVIMNHNVEGAIQRFEELIGKEAVQRELGFPYSIENEESMIFKFEKGDCTTEEFVEHVKRLAHQHNPNRPVTTEQVRDAWNISHAGIDQDKFDFLKRMKQQGKTIYMLSNINPIHWEHAVEKYHIADYYDYCCLSYEYKCSKPHLDIAQKFAKNRGIDPADAVFVDDLEVNRQMGWQMGWGVFESIYEYQKALQ